MNCIEKNFKIITLNNFHSILTAKKRKIAIFTVLIFFNYRPPHWKIWKNLIITNTWLNRYFGLVVSVLASNAKVSAGRWSESRYLRFVFRSVFASSGAQLTPVAGGELDTDCIDTGFLQFPCVFGALLLKDNAKKRMLYRRRGSRRGAGSQGRECGCSRNLTRTCSKKFWK